MNLHHTNPRENLSYIDGGNFQHWIAEALDLKGLKSKPEIFDAEKVVPVLDLGQGGFSSERALAGATSSAGSIAGVTTITTVRTPDLRYSNEKRERCARIHSLYAYVAFNQAGALAMNGRWFSYSFQLFDSAGTGRIYIARQEQEIITARGFYAFNLLALSNWHGYVLPGYAAETTITLQADFVGAGGAAFPAGTTAGYASSYTIKSKGGQLPI